MIEKIIYQHLTFAIIVRRNYSKNGIEFFSNDTDSQQLGYMKRPAGYEIIPHRHNLIKREVHLTQEVLFVKYGKIRADFYTDDQVYIKSTILNTGDVILLSNGGHGFTMLEESELIEVKQGPYCGDMDKIRFSKVDENKIKIDDEF
jgi:hypothetical protein